MKNIKITGEWDGDPIWREETPEETLSKELEANIKKDGNNV